VSVRGTTAGWGTGALEEGARADFGRMRAERRKAVFAAMAADDLDALVLGREAHARYASGARRLWTEGPRPFGPGCIAVAKTGAVHLLSTWDDGIPPEVGHDQLFGITWNGGNLFANLTAIEGLGEARRLGVDGMSPGMGQLLAALAPSAEVVDATRLLSDVMAVKTFDELACIRTSVLVAEAGLDHALAGLVPGTTGRVLAGRAAERLAELGVTTPDFEALFRSTSPVGGPARRGRRGEGPVAAVEGGVPQLPTKDAFNSGTLVTCQVGGLYSGYGGPVTRTWLCPSGDGRPAEPTAGQLRLREHTRHLVGRLAEVLRPGRAAGDVLGAYRAAGETPPPGLLLAHGVGLGLQPPLVGAGLPDDAGAATTLAPGMVLFVTACVTDPEVGADLVGDTVLITDDGHELLSHHDHGPLGPALP